MLIKNKQKGMIKGGILSNPSGTMLDIKMDKRGYIYTSKSIVKKSRSSKKK